MPDTEQNDNNTALISLLERFSDLSGQDRVALSALNSQVATFTRREDVLNEGEAADWLPLVEDGWLAQYRLLDDGRRYVLKFNLPGDVIDGTFPFRENVPYSVEALTDGRLVLFPAKALTDLIAGSAGIAKAFLLLEGYEHAFLRDRLMTLTRLTAYERAAHLCLELLTRLEVAGIARDNSFTLPISQSTLSDALGLSAVHVNRVFGRLEEEGFISRTKNVLRVEDRDALTRICHFRPQAALSGYTERPAAKGAQELTSASRGKDRKSV